MTKNIVDFVKEKDVTSFKSEICKILTGKIRVKLENIKQDIIDESYDTREFFEFLGAELFTEDDSHISVVFPTKALLEYAVKQLPEDIDYDIFYYDGLEDEEFSEAEYGIDIEDILDGDHDHAIELVIYKEDKELEEDVDIFCLGEGAELPVKIRNTGAHKKLQKHLISVFGKDPYYEKVINSVSTADFKKNKASLIAVRGANAWAQVAKESNKFIDSLMKEDLDEANQNEKGRLVKRKVSFAKKKRGGKLLNKRQKRRRGKTSQGVGKGYKAKGAGWKVKQIAANRKRKISKRTNVVAQKKGKRFAARSRLIRKRLGYKTGT